MDKPMLLKVKDVAASLSICERTVWQMITDGEIESVKVGGCRRIPRAALVAYVTSLREAAAR